MQALSHYRVLEQIGEGGMGVVYRARDERLDRDVALKVLPFGALGDEAARKRFRKEALALSKLNHPNIAIIHDFDSENDTDFLVEELIAGLSLSEMLLSGPLPEREIINLGLQLCEGLAAAHDQGIVHRDLKPGNIRVTPDARVKILDFGLAKVLRTAAAGSDTDATASLTETQTVSGTFPYMAPEQLLNEKLDARSDIWAAGCVLYEMATGQRPFLGYGPALIDAILHQQPAAPGRLNHKLSPGLESIILKSLEKDSSLRYQGAPEIKADLLRLKRQMSATEAVPFVPAQPGWLATHWKSVAWLSAAMGLIVFLAAITVYWVFVYRRAPKVVEFETTRLTFEPNFALTPAISPDGKMLAFSSDRDGNFEIYVQQVNGAQALRLTHNEARDDEPAFSPDGAHVAFHSARDGGGVYVVNTMGGNERKIADRGRQPRYSPDGTTISYLVATTGPAKMFLVPANGGEPRPFQPGFEILPVTWTMYPPVLWSADGKYLLFQGLRAQDRRDDWWVAPVEGGTAIRLGMPESKPGDVSRLEAWAGNYVYFADGSTVGGVNLFRVPLRRDPWRVAGSRQRLTSGGSVQVEASISDDRRLVFTSMSSLPLLASAPLNANSGVAGTLEVMPGDAATKTGLSVAADGSKLAYAAMLIASSRRELRVRDVRTGHEDLHPLLGQILLPEPRLSRDGSKITYRSWVGTKPGFYLAESSGDVAPKVLCESCRIVDFFSDSSEVLLIDGKQPNDLVRQDTAEGTRRLVLRTGFGIYSASLSPDGAHIALVTPTDNATVAPPMLSIVGTEASTPVQQVPVKVVEGHALIPHRPSWSPNGNLLYYLAVYDGNPCVWAQRLGRNANPEGAPFVVYHSHHSPVINEWFYGDLFAVAPNRLYLRLNDLKGNVWSMQLQD